MSAFSDARTVNCRTCGAPIIWLKTKTGKSMPVDAGTVKRPVSIYDPELGHMTHFGTCPQAKDWSHKKRPAYSKGYRGRFR